MPEKLMRQTSVKMTVLLHKQANDWFHPLLTVSTKDYYHIYLQERLDHMCHLPWHHGFWNSNHMHEKVLLP